MKKSILLGSSILAAMATVAPALAQDGDEVIVTATKREQTLQEVPIAVSVVDSEVIDRANILDLLDLQSVVPSLRVSQLQQSGNSTFIIRGFGNGANNVGIEPSVAVYIDGVYRTRSAGAISDFPDVERVEVLRGPQSTLFGKNASVGVISFVTREPQFEWGGSIEGSVGNFNQRNVKGYLTGPLSDDTAFSLAVNYNQRDGYAENLIDGTELNDRDRFGVRGQILWEPADNVSARLIADYDKLDEVCCYAPNIFNGPTGAGVAALGGQVPDDPFAYETFLDVNPTNEIINAGFSGEFTFDLGWAELTSISAFRSQDLASNGDVDFTSLTAIQQNNLEYQIETFTQEIRLAGSTDRLDWLVGGFYFDEDVDLTSDLLFDSAFAPFADVLSGGATSALEGALVGAGILPTGSVFFEQGTGTREAFTQANENYSIFAQADFQITDRLTLTGGISYIEDEKTVIGSAVNDDLYASLDLAASPFSDVIGQIVLGGAFADATGLEPTSANIGAFAVANPATFAAIQAGAAAATPGAIAGLQQLQFLPGFAAFPNDFESGQTNDDDITYTARLAWDVSDRINTYVSYATGFKATSWNLTRDSSPFAADFGALQSAGLVPTNRTAGTRFAGPESTEVIEVGLKASFPRLQVNMALFDQSVEGFQSTIFQGTGFVLANAGEQSTRGFEIDATWNPVDPLTLIFAGTFLDPEYDDFVGAPGFTAVDPANNLFSPASVDLTGATPAGIHEMSLYFAAQYDHDFGNGTTGFIRGDYQYEDEVQIVDNVPEAIATREVSLFNASAGVTWENGVDVFVWGRNLTEDEYLQSAFPTVAQNFSFNGYPNQPRTYGVTVRKSW